MKRSHDFSARAFIALVLALCLLPALAMPFLPPARASANEILSPTPALLDAQGRVNPKVLNECSDYLADHFGFRQHMIGLWSRLHSLFQSSPNEQVLAGREGWLFYSPTLTDYTGGHLSDEALRAVARRLLDLQNRAEDRGGDFLFVIAPNKNSLYASYMPAWISDKHEDCSARRLLPLLEEYGVHYVDLFSLELPYYRTDTHWTPEGAAMAADAILGRWDRKRSYAELPFVRDGLHRGDLYEMLYPAGPGGEPELRAQTVWSYECLADPKGGDAITIRTENPEGRGSLYCWRDSFGVALYPFLAQDFASATFTRKTSYELPEEDFDVYLLEIVERNIPNLLEEGETS